PGRNVTGHFSNVFILSSSRRISIVSVLKPNVSWLSVLSMLNEEEQEGVEGDEAGEPAFES
ncbi:hypothetical protein P5E35_14635, partial [Clostridium perfringens]|nr:hypothetical protein [Clostridium perfringens]